MVKEQGKGHLFKLDCTKEVVCHIHLNRCICVKLLQRKQLYFLNVAEQNKMICCIKVLIVSL